ncbi:hypothetical protein ACFV7R_06175 [Streptomyces sp. NPDC059866]|uniref:hypothetical protein n=1 Tax=Streptomyces sp. NPDC059866 TaxID=3346978 RepID=UPI00365CAA7E
MSDVEPLTVDEERFWRALMRVTVALPRSLDADLLRSTGLSLTDHVVLVNLSEAKNQELRMTDLAAACALSASRITRTPLKQIDSTIVRVRRTPPPPRPARRPATDDNAADGGGRPRVCDTPLGADLEEWFTALTVTEEAPLAGRDTASRGAAD